MYLWAFWFAGWCILDKIETDVHHNEGTWSQCNSIARIGVFFMVLLDHHDNWAIALSPRRLGVHVLFGGYCYIIDLLFLDLNDLLSSFFSVFFHSWVRFRQQKYLFRFKTRSQFTLKCYTDFLISNPYACVSRLYLTIYIWTISGFGCTNNIYYSLTCGFDLFMVFSHLTRPDLLNPRCIFL